MPMSEWTRVAVAVCVAGAAIALSGCAAAGEAHANPDYVIKAPATTSRVRSEQVFLDAGFELEMAEKWDSALTHYAAVLNRRIDASARLTAQCALRAAMCHMALEHENAATELLEGILHDPYVAPDEDFPALPGGGGAGLRIAAETRLRELGGDPPGLYAAALAARDVGLAEIAVVSLARIGDTFSKEALEKAALDPKLDAQTRDVIAAELKGWGSRKR
jgi:hypothetical protein